MTTAGDFICLCMKKHQGELQAALTRLDDIAAHYELPRAWCEFYIRWELTHG